ncbi:hypothetical protein BC833DRAFT_511575, partial [Globomyces pollinis-pini]
RQFTCSFEGCGKSYTRLFTLKLHIKTIHENIKPYKCTFDDCTLSFSRRHNLIRHTKVH